MADLMTTSGAGPEAGRVEIGFFSFTEITDPAQHRAYNEWHQLDHLPEQYPLDGVVWGQRWVRSPACRAAGPPPGDADFDAVHYVTCYLMTGPVEPTLRNFKDLGAELHRLDRFFEARRAVLSGPFRVTGAHAAARVRVSAAAVPFRPNLGAFVALWSTAGNGADPAVGAPVDRLLALDGVAGVWQFAAHPAGAEYGWRSLGHSALVCYLDSPPLEVAPAIAAILRPAEDAGAAPLLMGPLETITPWQWNWFDADGPAVA
jgi:hypothetical protein